MTHRYNSQINARSLVKWDVVEGFKNIEIWSTLAWGEISARYGRTIFGVFWNVISFAVFCIAIIVIFGAIPSAQAINFGPHVVVGFLIYSYIASLITDACGVFVQNESWLKSTRLPYGIFVYKGIMRNTIIFGFNLLAAIAILLIFYDLKLFVAQWLVVPAFFIILANSVATYFLLGVVCARFRDITHLIITLMRFSLFVTPIMWTAGGDGIRGKIAVINPFTHFIEIVREPVLYGSMAFTSWMIILAFTVVLWLITIIVYVRVRKRFIYWL